jgi:inorganic pyrophosphatase
MNLDRVSSGNNIPNEINVIIEIPSHSDPVKYELDKETGAMFVDRFMSTAIESAPATTAVLPLLEVYGELIKP